MGGGGVLGTGGATGGGVGHAAGAGAATGGGMDAAVGGAAGGGAAIGGAVGGTTGGAEDGRVGSPVLGRRLGATLELGPLGRNSSPGMNEVPALRSTVGAGGVARRSPSRCPSCGMGPRAAATPSMRKRAAVKRASSRSEALPSPRRPGGGARGNAGEEDDGPGRGAGGGGAAGGASWRVGGASRRVGDTPPVLALRSPSVSAATSPSLGRHRMGSGRRGACPGCALWSPPRMRTNSSPGRAGPGPGAEAGVGGEDGEVWRGCTACGGCVGCRGWGGGDACGAEDGGGRGHEAASLAAASRRGGGAVVSTLAALPAGAVLAAGAALAAGAPPVGAARPPPSKSTAMPSSVAPTVGCMGSPRTGATPGCSTLPGGALVAGSGLGRGPSRAEAAAGVRGTAGGSSRIRRGCVGGCGAGAGRTSAGAGGVAPGTPLRAGLETAEGAAGCGGLGCGGLGCPGVAVPRYWNPWNASPVVDAPRGSGEGAWLGGVGGAVPRRAWDSAGGTRGG